jgi:hypothetical protein
MAGRGRFREFTAMFVAASMLGTSAASAAAPVARNVDPLVALSVFGTAQSRAAVCAAGANAAAAAGTAVAAQAPAAGCVLPVLDAPPVAAAPPPPPPAEVALAPAAASGGVSVLPLLLGLAAIVAIAAVVIKHNDSSGEIDLPISP